MAHNRPNRFPAGGLGLFRTVTPLAAGNNVVTHNLGGLTPAMVEVRNNTTGAEVAVRVTAETATAVTITVGAPVASARITIIS
jgi:hypothetical protein